MNGLRGGMGALCACASERVSECGVIDLFESLKTYTLILFDPI